jgi:hypothetical protein
MNSLTAARLGISLALLAGCARAPREDAVPEAAARPLSRAEVKSLLPPRLQGADGLATGSQTNERSVP